MKYENFEQIKEIVADIKKQEEKLTILEFAPCIVLKVPGFDGICIETRFEEDMTSIAIKFVKTLIHDSENRISNYKGQLAKL